MISTGIKGLDGVLTGLKAGDNVVWQIDDVSDYIDFVQPFVQEALKQKKKVIYFRFAAHRELIAPSKQIKRYDLDACEGFESFTSKINQTITQEGEGAYYVFDCLSELLSAWATDLMIGNFFMVTCPYLFELKTLTYFSLLRNSHSFKSIARIRETTQLLIDVYHCEGSCYIHPLKVWNRYSPTMFLPHRKEKEHFVPVTDSVNAGKILSHIHEKGADDAKRNLDHWDRLFLEAEELIESGAPREKIQETTLKICTLMISKNEKILPMAISHFTLEELIEIKSRLIGTGFIGGKATGMLLARKILSENKSLGWKKLSEEHDSFYIGSDIFYSYIVQNHWWKLRMEQKTDKGYFRMAEILKNKLLYGAFDEEIMEQFQQVIEYFGSSPIIVRSSSLLEDGFGNAFAGKYDSIFLANQGSPEQRYVQFAEAVKKIYSSTMSEDALAYRKQRGLDKLDEQMALLVQRVSGAHHKNYFFPDLAGVGVSSNIYLWNEKMDPKAGMLRMVFGLGTRAVNRVEGDYPRMVALDEPLRRPYAEKEDLRKFSQHSIDLIDTQVNQLKTEDIQTLIDGKTYSDLTRIAVRDDEATAMMNGREGQAKEYWIVTLDPLFKERSLADHFGKILRTLEESYHYPIEIEFTVNFTGEKNYRVNLLQCRPMQTRGIGRKITMPAKIKKEQTLFESKGYFLGGNVMQKIGRVILIDPEKYNSLKLSDKYEAARMIGQLNRAIGNKEEMPTLLMGPGRWGTTTPSLGVPVKFAEINNMAVLAEISFSAGNLMPELSFGTHFFMDLVETNIFYIALFPEKKEVLFNRDWFKKSGNCFSKLLPESARYEDLIHVYDVRDRNVHLYSDVVSQRVLCFSEGPKNVSPA
ncbi:MAG: PEP/pyruvate-binding domain-containing protein [Elusimicrobia bacterium]|nr:PEP/pyruvate-binding domain-containing protein [Candidatus Obscuribacterium magneticum]